MTALFADEPSAVEAASLLLATLSERGDDAKVLSLGAVDEIDWVRLTQAQFAPIEIGTGFWIVPSWSDIPVAATKTIRLDPGMAFGTGTHPTTRMCLRWIAAQAARGAAPPRRVLDYGCGSGVLAIAAALHGASDVDAVDIDAAAVTATRANALANGVVLRAGTSEIAHGRYDLVVANILATPLKLLAPLLASYLAEGASLLLSGILERQADELRAAYAPWLRLEVAAADDGWILMTATPRPVNATDRVA